MFGCIAPPRQNRNLMRSSSQDSREFHGDPRFDQRPSSALMMRQRPASVRTTRGKSAASAGGPTISVFLERSATPPALPAHQPTPIKQPKIKRLDKWIGHLLNESTSNRTPQPQQNHHHQNHLQQQNSIEQRAGEWRYADDVRVNIAPLASTDIDADMRIPPEPPRSRFGPPPSRATSVLQSLREQKENLEFDERRRQASTLPNSSSNSYSHSQSQSGYGGTLQRHEQTPVRADTYTSSIDDSYETRHLDDMHVVFLQANDEVKRIILPPVIHSMHQVKMAFVRTFPNVTRSFVEQAHVKIYIQEPTKGALFYELEDPGDIKNKSVLRLREKTTNPRIMSPIAFHDQPDYHSETEQDDGRRFVSLARPASAMAAPHADFMPKMINNQHKPMYDPYSDPYNSDTSSHDSRSVTRSGSATPVIDRESRVRMETMERQLAGLSNLVHSALVSKGLSESTQRDMAELRKEILSMHPDSARESSEEPTSSIPEWQSSHTAHQLNVLRNKLREANYELVQLKKTAQVNAQTANTLIREAGDRIEKIVGDKIRNGARSMPPSIAPKLVAEDNYPNDQQRNEHASRLAELLHDLTSFETNVENVRGSVLANQKKLRMSEVEQLTEKLTDIGRIAAGLKTAFPPIQSIIEQRIKQDMERVVREEKFIRDQTSAVDQSLRRCKALANIMVTMKKLAMVQDPTIQRHKKSDTHGSPKLPPKPVPIQAVPMPPPTVHHGTTTPRMVSQTPPPAPVPPPPPPPMPLIPLMPQSTSHSQDNHYTPNYSVGRSLNNINFNNSNSHPNPPEIPESPKSPVNLLDGVLEEVGQPGQPPRPPSRFSVQDVRQKFNKPPELPDQIRNLIEDVARRASPGPERDATIERRQDLEEHQKRLAEKQRLLRDQFLQLKELAPQQPKN